MIIIFEILIGSFRYILSLFILSKYYIRIFFYKMFIKLGFLENYIFSILFKGK